MRSQIWRRRAIIGLVFILAGAIGWESWQATVAAAANGGRPSPWLWPVTLEGLLAILVLVYWDARHAHRDYAWVVQVAVWVVTASAAAVQVLDAPATWLGRSTAALTPAMLLLAVEFAVWLLYGAAVGAVADQRHDVRDGGPPRPGETAEGVPLVAGATQPTRLVRGTPPPSTVPSSENGGHGPDTGGVNLPDRPATVTTPTVTVPSQPPTPPTPTPTTLWVPDKKADQSLRRYKDNPAEFDRIITERGLDRDAVMEVARRRGWPVANGHRKAVPV